MALIQPSVAGFAIPLLEHGEPELEVMTPEGVQTMAQILPQPFGPWSLAQRAPGNGD
jgi:hypothetical protein